MRHLIKAGHQCVVLRRSTGSRKGTRQRGCGRNNIAERVHKEVKIAPHILDDGAGAVVDPALQALVPLLQYDDVVIEGGNSYDLDDIRRADEPEPKGIDEMLGLAAGGWGAGAALAS